MTTAIERSREACIRQVLEQSLASLVSAVDGLFVAMKGIGAADLVRAEQRLRTAVHRIGGEAIRLALDGADKELRAQLREECRIHLDGRGHWCGGSLHSNGRKSITVLTLFGEVQVRQWVGQCRTCGRLFGTLGELLRLVDGMTPASASLVGLNAVAVPYEPARKLILESAGLEVDDNRIKRLVDALGPHAKACMEEVGRLRRDGFPPKGTRVYVMMDGGRIRMREGGGVWREPCTALILWQDRFGRFHKRGISHPTDKERVLRVLDGWMKRFAPGTHWEVVVIADGAEWIWKWAEKYPWVVGILDYYHVKENVWKAANVLHGEGTPEARHWADKIMDQLWRGWTRKAVRVLERMKPRDPAAKEKRKAIETLAGYIERHAPMIRFGQNRNSGRFIGSGAIESACKQLFSMRMKGPGMFWSEAGAGNLMALRTLYITERWDQLWQGNPRLAA
jgi:hypothetical protein